MRLGSFNLSLQTHLTSQNLLNHQPTLRCGTATCYSTFLLCEAGRGPLTHPHRKAGQGPLTHPHCEAGRGPLTHPHCEGGWGPLTHPHRKAGWGPLTNPHCCYLHFSESRGNVQADMTYKQLAQCWLKLLQADMTYRLGWYPPVQLENPSPKQLSQWLA